MKKLLLLFIIPIFFIGMIRNVKAYNYRYAIAFDFTYVEMPIGENIYEYLPEAYVYDLNTGDEITRDDMIYSYDYQGIKLSNIDLTRAGNSFIYMTASHEYLSAESAFKRIDIHIYDDEEPVISMNNHISISYKEDFNINNYLRYTDNASTPCSIVVLGEYENRVVGDYELSVLVTDASNNTAEKEIYLNIYDNVKPVITCSDRIDVDFDKEINLEEYIKVIDEYDGIIDYEYTDFDKSKLGESTILITATDSSGNVSTKEVVINVCDKTAPIILINDKELNINEDYDLYQNIISVTDNFDEYEISDIKISKTKIGTKRYLVKYFITDSSNNEAIAECIVNYTYNNVPVIEGINLDDLKDVFDPLYYVNCYDVEDGDLNDKVMVIEMNYKEKYCIYEVYDSDDNVVRQRIDFINLEDLDKYEGKSNIIFPKDEIVEEKTEENTDTNRNVNEYKSINYNFIYYIVLGVIVLGILIFIIVKHFRKKMV